MAQLNITLNQEEIQALLLEDQGEAFKKILQASLNKILQAESAEQLKAGPYERSEERTDSRNGSRDRDLNTERSLQDACLRKLLPQRGGACCRNGGDGRQRRVHPEGLSGHGNAVRHLVLQVCGV